MCVVDSLTFNLKELKEGKHSYSFTLDDRYFSALDQDEVKAGKVVVGIVLTTVDETHFQLNIDFQGEVVIPCDLCLEDMEQTVEGSSHLVVVLGGEESDDENIIAVSDADGVLDLSWLVYEFVALAIPIKHVHEPGNCAPAMIEVLDELSAARSSGEDDETIDPRWSKLKELVRSSDVAEA